MRTACDATPEQILHFQGDLLQGEQNLLCAVHAELKLCLKHEAIMAFAAFQEINVLLLEISVTISNMNPYVQY